MATIPTPRTWTPGETPTGQQLNTDIRDGFGFLMSPPRVKVYNSIGQSINQAITLLTWDTEVYDSDGMHSTSSNTSRLTAVTAGVYEIVLHIDWQKVNNSNGGNRLSAIKLNAAGDTTFTTTAEIGGDYIFIPTSDSTAPQTNHLSIHRFLNAGDHVEAIVLPTFGSAVSTIPSAGQGAMTFFAARWVSAS